VIRDTTQFIEVVDRLGELEKVNLRGRIQTVSGAVVAVNKWLAVDRDLARRLVVLTSEYVYHAFVRGNPRRDLFRYDSCHGLEGLHVHRFDTDGLQSAIRDVEADRMPPFDEVIREADALAAWLAEYDRSGGA